jgi:hypothetical protein
MIKIFESKVSDVELRKTGYHTIRTNEVEVSLEALDIAKMVMEEVDNVQ